MDTRNINKATYKFHARLSRVRYLPCSTGRPFWFASYLVNEELIAYIRSERYLVSDVLAYRQKHLALNRMHGQHPVRHTKQQGFQND